MQSRSSRNPGDGFSDALLASARLPDDLDFSRGEIYFFWQPPHARTLARLLAREPRAPILIGRYAAETPVRASRLPYACPADFFSLRSLVEIERAGIDAQQRWTGEPAPDYMGMPLVDGDLPRLRFWNEVLPAAGMLCYLARTCPGLQVYSDWLGARLARSTGLKVRRLRWSDVSDHNWPPRRWLREHFTPAAAPAKTNGRRAGSRADGEIVFALAGWVEERMLDVFPVQEMVAAGHRCRLWTNQHTADLYALIARTGVACEGWEYPSPAKSVGALQAAVRNWYRSAARAGYFAPLQGELAETVVDLMGWERWAPKLVAMHRCVTRRLQKSRPSLLVAPAEKDWGPYCALHAARHLGIPTIGIKHATWAPGSYLERFDDIHYVPTAADHVLAYTPMDAEVRTQVDPSGRRLVQWHGNPRLEKSMPVAESGPRPLRLLIGASGAGPGRTMSLRRVAIANNVRLIDALLNRLGDRIGVRLHSWDAATQYPPHLQRLILPADQSLLDQLAVHAGLVTTYSTIAYDAAAAGLPVFFWDYGDLDMHQSEIATRGGGVALRDLDTLCKAARRFLDDPLYHAQLQQRATAFRSLLSHSSHDRRAWLDSVRAGGAPVALTALIEGIGSH